MASGLIDKLTNFLMPVEEETQPAEAPPVAGERRAQLRVHSPAALKVFIASPVEFDDVKLCADYLKANVAVLINLEAVDDAVKQRIGDFLDGLLVITGGASQRVSDSVFVYVPANVDINKEMYAYSVPTYVKRKKE
ncbi:cell division protein SepF [Anaeroselena agilis]|uniref:Cell division protein SepF n=1 Tax=Anaeroselena agilis TaxID=3063788 RepID=A0ABU3NUR0_9FIRM|nr:cell division protein SepF [Selenomonadales bacterium 4137-cl]